MQSRPVGGQVWRHSKSGGHYHVRDFVYNSITDQVDVVYAPLYACDIKVFTRQMEGHPKAWLSVDETGAPRFVLLEATRDPGKYWQGEWPPRHPGEGRDPDAEASP